MRLSLSLLSAVRRGLSFSERGVCAIPHPRKAKRGGEDAFFSHALGVGVADGVGGCASQNIDPAIYTRNVMKFTLDAVKNTSPASGITALDALTHGWAAANREGYPGACPATLVTIVDECFASILNLGDCGTILVREGKMVFQSKSQQHSFNCPFQLPVDPPHRGEQTKLELREGDVFLCASDGVLDNVEVDALIKLLRLVNDDGCERVAAAIGQKASVCGADQTFMSPFAKQATAMGYRYMGGKLDDITALVARVGPSSGEGMPAGLPELIGDLLPSAR